MSLKFKVIQRGQPGVVGGGVKKYYASPVSRNEVTVRELTPLVEKTTSMGGADIRAIMYAAVDLIPQFLSQGDIVRLGDLGSFRLSISSEGRDTEEEVTASAIRFAKIIFTPGELLREILGKQRYVKV